MRHETACSVITSWAGTITKVEAAATMTTSIYNGISQH